MTYNQLSMDDINEKLKEKCVETTQDYVDTKTKSTFKCLICGKYFKNKYDNIRYWKKCGCLECQKEERLKENLQKRLSHRKDVLKEKLNKNVKFISFSDDCETCICECKICGEIFETSYDSLIQGCMHRKCAMKLMKRYRLSNDDLDKFIAENNSNFIILDYGDPYGNDSEVCKCKCLLCGHIWYSKRSNIKKGRGCPECAKINRVENRKRYIADYNNELMIFNLELVKILDQTDKITSTTNILVRCKICGFIFSTTLSYLKRYNIGCKNCNELKRREAFVKRVHQELKNKNTHLHIISDFLYSVDVVTVYCDECKKTFEREVHSLLRNPTCANCTSNSHMEYCSINYFNSNDISFELHKTFDNLRGVNNGKLSYDFYLKDYNLLIEIQGKQHFEPIEYFGGEKQFRIQQEHDRRKREYAKFHNIELLEIGYFDKDNIEEILSKKFNINNIEKSA